MACLHKNTWAISILRNSQVVRMLTLQGRRSTVKDNRLPVIIGPPNHPQDFTANWLVDVDNALQRRYVARGDSLADGVNSRRLSGHLEVMPGNLDINVISEKLVQPRELDYTLAIAVETAFFGLGTKLRLHESLDLGVGWNAHLEGG
jgi:hypothetical protein